jgi:hypothetical protein
MSLAVLPVLVLVVLAFATVAAGNVGPAIFFSPSKVMVQPGQTTELSFRVGTCEDSISGYQLYLSFDPTVVELVSATQGSLYMYSGHPTWFIDEEEGPGAWHFFDTVMGTGTYVLPPGELLRLEFEAITYGCAELHIDSILLADIERENLPVGSFEHGHMFVVDPTGVEEGGGAVRLGPAYPNPFRSGTTVPYFAPAVEGEASVEIYNVAGRVVRRLGVPEGRTSGELSWDGRDESGRAVPASVYFLRLTTGTSTARCSLVKTE